MTVLGWFTYISHVHVHHHYRGHIVSKYFGTFLSLSFLHIYHTFSLHLALSFVSVRISKLSD